ncbi:MAG: hypothetical protein NC483_06980 [Ruminococcus sp.]|nr:hypothetical protein [Ruminococcus sp.]
MKQQIVVDNITYEVVATVHDDETNKDFVVYVDKNINKNEGLKLSCVLYYEEDGNLIPVKITEAEDKETARNIIMEVMGRINHIFKKNL